MSLYLYGVPFAGFECWRSDDRHPYFSGFYKTYSESVSSVFCIDHVQSSVIYSYVRPHLQSGATRSGSFLGISWVLDNQVVCEVTKLKELFERFYAEKVRDKLLEDVGNGITRFKIKGFKEEDEVFKALEKDFEDLFLQEGFTLQTCEGVPLSMKHKKTESEYSLSGRTVSDKNVQDVFRTYGLVNILEKQETTADSVDPNPIEKEIEALKDRYGCLQLRYDKLVKMKGAASSADWEAFDREKQKLCTDIGKLLPKLPKDHPDVKVLSNYSHVISNYLERPVFGLDDMENLKEHFLLLKQRYDELESNRADFEGEVQTLIYDIERKMSTLPVKHPDVEELKAYLDSLKNFKISHTCKLPMRFELRKPIKWCMTIAYLIIGSFLCLLSLDYSGDDGVIVWCLVIGVFYYLLWRLWDWKRLFKKILFKKI